MLLNCGVGEDSWESLGLQGDPTSPSWRKSGLNIHWKDWCWSWNSNTLATWCKELTHWKISWCWERLKAGGEGDSRGWDGWMASPTQWTWIWASSGSCDGQGGLACCIPWDCKEMDMTEWSNNSKDSANELGIHRELMNPDLSRGWWATREPLDNLALTPFISFKQYKMFSPF